MRSWVISVPIWGPQYVQVFIEHAAPALRMALAGFGESVRFVCHTDSPGEVTAALRPFPVQTLPVGLRPTYVTLQESHAQVISMADLGDVVVLLNADLVISGNLIRGCAQHFNSGKKAVVLLGIRTNLLTGLPPAGAEPRALLEWAWDHRHQIIRDLEWGTGSSMLPTNLFFVNDDSVVARGFHLHPVAIVKDHEITFGSTIDGDLLDVFDRSTLHVVTSPDDISMLEISEPSRRFPVRTEAGLTPARVAGAMRTRASPLHRWLFEQHRIIVRGSGNGCDDLPAVGEIMKIMNRHGH